MAISTPIYNTHLTLNEQALLNAAEMLWIVIANVNEGDRTKQSQDWQEAAARWRDNFHSVAAALQAKVA